MSQTYVLKTVKQKKTVRNNHRNGTQTSKQIHDCHKSKLKVEIVNK